VIFHFIAVGFAGEAMPIVAMFVAKPVILKTEGKLREDTGRQIKGKSNTGKQKTAADTAKLSPIQKRWMIHLPQRCRHGVRQ
jgi:hypothetical protein